MSRDETVCAVFSRRAQLRLSTLQRCNCHPFLMSRSIKSSMLLIVFSLLFAAVLPARALPLDFHSYKPPIHTGGADSDGDGLPNIDEVFFGSDPFKADADGDGFNDLAEFIAGTDPNNKNSFPLVDFTQLRNHQYLLGQTLLLRPIALTNTVFKVNSKSVTNDDGSVTTTSTTNYIALLLSWYKDGQLLDAQTNTVVTGTNIVDNGDGTFSTNLITTVTVIPGPLTENQVPLLIHRLGTNDSGKYHLLANYTNVTPNDLNKAFVNTIQISRDLQIEVLPVAPRHVIRQPAGSIAAFGDDGVGLVSKATNTPPGTNIVSFASGLLHAVAVTSDGLLVTWGTNTVGELDAPPISNAVKVAAGASHSLVLTDDGHVYAWGDNTFGQTTVPQGITNAIKIAAGRYCSAAVTADGRLFMWGENSHGQCTPPAGLGKVVDVAAGLYHAAAITADGVVHAWGDNTFGQTNVPSSSFTIEAGSISCGANHTVALLRDGTVVAWGANSSGQATLPTGFYRAIKVVSGADYTAALGLDGKIVCWGNKTAKAFQANNKTNSPAFTDISGGYDVIFAMKPNPDTDADGVNDDYEAVTDTNPAFADSDNDGLEDGIELLLGTNPLIPDSDGDGISDYYEVINGLDPLVPLPGPDSSLDVVSVDNLFDVSFFAVLPGLYQLQLRVNDTDWINIGDPTNLVSGWSNGPFSITYSTFPAGWDDTIKPSKNSGFFRALPQRPPPIGPGEGSAEGIIYGTVVTVGSVKPSQAAIPTSAVDLQAISVGFSHDLALKNDGTVIAWGDDESGQTEVPDTLPTISLISAGGAHSLAVDNQGKVHAWGNNRSGQSSPPSIPGTVMAIGAGLNHSLALSSGGKVYAWGDNTFGQISVPGNLPAVKTIAAGFSHSVAVTTSGTVVAWGDNRYGQCNVPAGLSQVVAVTAGYGHTVALLEDGTVRAWGINTNGEVNVPAGLSGVIAISAGASHTVALKNDHTIVRWGAAAALAGEISADFTDIQLIAAGGSRTLLVKVPVDSDADGLDNYFELQLGSDPFNAYTTGDNVIDPLYTDGWKYFNGYDPLVPIRDKDGAASLSKTSQIVVLQAFTVSGFDYQLYSATSLTNWAGTNLTNLTKVGGPVAGITDFSLITNIVDSVPQLFYQLRPLPLITTP